MTDQREALWEREALDELVQLRAELRWLDRWLHGHGTGISSKEMALAALLGRPPEPERFPRDNGDLGRCLDAYRSAPLSLRLRMGSVLRMYYSALGDHGEPAR